MAFTISSYEPWTIWWLKHSVWRPSVWRPFSLKTLQWRTTCFSKVEQKLERSSNFQNRFCRQVSKESIFCLIGPNRALNIGPIFGPIFDNFVKSFEVFRNLRLRFDTFTIRFRLEPLDAPRRNLLRPPFTLIFFFSLLRFSIKCVVLKVIHGSFVPNFSDGYIFENGFVFRFHFRFNFCQFSSSVTLGDWNTIIFTLTLY